MYFIFLRTISTGTPDTVIRINASSSAAPLFRRA
jgi:hypothetical protein